MSPPPSFLLKTTTTKTKTTTISYEIPTNQQLPVQIARSSFCYVSLPLLYFCLSLSLTSSFRLLLLLSPASALLLSVFLSVLPYTSVSFPLCSLFSVFLLFFCLLSSSLSLYLFASFCMFDSVCLSTSTFASSVCSFCLSAFVVASFLYFSPLPSFLSLCLSIFLSVSFLLYALALALCTRSFCSFSAAASYKRLLCPCNFGKMRWRRCGWRGRRRGREEESGSRARGGGWIFWMVGMQMGMVDL